MGRYVLKRLGIALPTLFIIITATFFLLRAAPGGPFDADRELSPEALANLNARYGLDKSPFEQFLMYISGLLRGDFGPSFRYRDVSVTEIIADRLPVSLTVGLLALALAVALGLWAGIVMARNRAGWLDTVLNAASSLLIAVPSFVTAPLLALLFGVTLGWLPVAGWGRGAPPYLVLPVVALALPNAAYIARLMRASLLETLGSDHIRTARAKGVPDHMILRRHVLPPAMLPVITYLGPAAAGILTGSVVIEQIFALPGTGLAFVQGALNRDYTVVMGLVIVYASLIIVINLLTDIAYGWLDPALRVSR